MITEYTEIELVAYQKGWAAWEESIDCPSENIKNPYTPETDCWRAWNKGWNNNEYKVYE